MQQTQAAPKQRSPVGEKKRAVRGLGTENNLDQTEIKGGGRPHLSSEAKHRTKAKELKRWGGVVVGCLFRRRKTSEGRGQKRKNRHTQQEERVRW